MNFGDQNATIQALLAIQLEWTSNDSYAGRVANIAGTGTGGANGSSYLQPGTTAIDDSAADSLYGNGNSDWFFYASVDDILQDSESGEQLTDLSA